MSATLITPSYVFTPGAAGVGTLDLSAISGFDVKRLVAVINLTRNLLIFAPTVAGYSSIAGSVLTLSVDTSTHSSGDKLWIRYDNGDDNRVNGAPVSLANPMPVTDEAMQLLAHILRAVENPLWMDTASGRLRVVLDALGGAQTLGTVSTVSTVGTLQNITSLGGVVAATAIMDAMTTAWASASRARIS